MRQLHYLQELTSKTILLGFIDQLREEWLYLMESEELSQAIPDRVLMIMVDSHVDQLVYRIQICGCQGHDATLLLRFVGYFNSFFYESLLCARAIILLARKESMYQRLR